MREFLVGWRSEIMKMVEGLAVMTMKVDRGQILMGDRVSILETKVKALEA